ncbi:error-prone DNA polymerase [Brucella anthropi]|uniref:Error-prone DNA polymerase n=1 Tax=Brucella anthropi (strain ATCC 49188 / DSM 6882 / CCUG 24695 / JCM 21032 / LMG 3331 / NBRC 15819 / NCTC 12168 / Alc 37) TaxID=439375 RepID=A6WV06_BRUA4|nr:error-prone DNA polymerase [Brucella anthropi]ABS12810.1 DNA polymerase III, alpha subunit [Brucella anthropi ATCC 49188]AIK43547.1 DNA polymerase III, alpha subunit [Brucella anthropi]KAB2734854.1 error-prone DNA polymerase [Brucella anthropi]KAB2753042.1 error-prone DNA polymerase [Brucella anthropi]KAB2779292.1 error-prone DNA polymerase [Brucella anthropi]
MAPYFEMAAASNFSFLCGASHPQELVARAHELGLSGIGIADRNTLAGVVRAHAAWKDFRDKSDFRLFIGCRLSFTDGTPDMVVYPRDRPAYGQLCRLLTEGKARAAIKGECHLEWGDLLFRARQFQIAVFPPEDDRPDFAARLTEIAQAAPGSVWLALAMPHQGHDGRRAERIARFAAEANVPLLATNDVLYHHPDRRALQDVLTATRYHTTVFAAGQLLEKNAERHLKPPKEMLRLFRDYAEAVEATADFVAPITFQLDELKYDYPDEPVPPGKTPQQHLHDLTWEGAARHYGANSIPPKVQTLIHKELALIEKLQYAAYFLTVYDIVSYARREDILCQGRGSAANSVVCFCLGVTGVDPTQVDLLFERFLSVERKEPPDIDVDFEHERREEVMQYVYKRYSRDRAAIVATVISYRSRSAIRDVGKALGLTEDVTAALANTVWGISGGGIDKQHIRQAGLDPDNPIIRRAVELAITLIGFPRHLSQHVGGFVLTRDRLDETVPIGPAAMEDRSFIEWDKDDIDEVGLMKVDVLSLGMLTCIRKAFDLIHQHKPEKYDGKKLTLANLPREDEAVYDMLCKGDSLGVFQVESRAQMNMLPRLRPREFYDLVIEVAIVRPGPIQGDMVHPYLRRRNNEEPCTLPSPAPEYGPPDELLQILGKTKGVPLFQEQAMRIAMEAAKFTPDEANQLRRAMATFRKMGTIHTMETKMIEGMVNRGYDRTFAENCFNQIKGFGEYGFPESHAASFAHLVYISAWIKCHHPEVFAAALLNSQPMGFYAPAQIVRDAREHGVTVLPVDVNFSHWDNMLEDTLDIRPALRLGFRQIDGFSKRDTELLIADRQEPYRTIEDMHRRLRLDRRAFTLLADADAFGSLDIDRRAALWAVRRLPNDETLPLFRAAATSELAEEPRTKLPEMAASEHVIADYETTRLSLKGHPLQYLREGLAAEGVSTCRAVQEGADGRRMKVAGVVTVRQRPGSAKGVVFLTIEDETGIANIVVWPKIMKAFRREVMGARLIHIEGRLQRSPEGVVHLVASKLQDRSAALIEMSGREAQRLVAPSQMAHHPRNVKIMPNSRDFH